jgi:hypothetical protein
VEGTKRWRGKRVKGDRGVEGVERILNENVSL